MRALVIEASGLRKAHGRRCPAAVDGLDLTVDAGTVHGLLGPVGAGKSTTLQLLLGLTRADAGEIRVLGRSVPRELAQVMPRVGAMLQGPRFATSMTGRRNLVLLARASGVAKERVEETLERVGLAGQHHTRVRAYSTPMRQRLALAAALLRSPDLLLLDEPTSGLDPAGAREVWQLIRDLAGEGVSVLVSSRALDEVQQSCDTVTVLERGRALATGPVDDLVGEARTRTRVGTDSPDRALDLLREAGFGVELDGADPGADLLVEGHEHPAEISRVLAGHEIFVQELSAVRPDLESVFAQLTSSPRPDPGPAQGDAP